MKPKAFRCELVSWQAVRRFAFEVALEIKRSGYKPDTVIAIARGGFVPARLLCDFLQIYDLASIRVEHYLQAARKKPSARLKHPLQIDVSGKQVLIVDDVCDSGETYRVAFDHIAGCSAAAIRTAALQHKTGACFEPHFVAGHIQEWRWLIYPWAVTEDVSGLIEQMVEPPETPRELSERLFEDHGIRLSEARLRDIFRLMRNETSSGYSGRQS